MLTTNKWGDLDAAAKTWNAWKTAYKTADMKERVRRIATGKNDAHDALRQTVAPQGTAIDNHANKNDLEDYVYNLAAAATKEKVVLAQLMAGIAAMTINNEALVATESKLVAEVTRVLELKDEETLFTQVTPRQLLDHLQSICGGLYAINVLALQNEMQEYHTDSEGILEYINALEAAQKKSKRGTGNNQITDETLLIIATNTMLKKSAHP